MCFTANYNLRESQGSCLFWGSDWLMNTSLGGRPGNSQTNDFIISAWYSGSMLQHGRVVEFTCLLFFPCPSKRCLGQRKKGFLKSRRDGLMLTAYRYTFPKLTKEFACKQHWRWFGDKNTSSSEQWVWVKIFLFKTQTLALHIREGGRPYSPQHKNHVLHCNEPLSFSTRNSAGIKA